MAKQTGTILAIAVTRDALRLAELRGSGGAVSVTKRSTLAWPSPEGSSPEADPTARGSALKQHLADEGYSAKRAAVGLPGSWVLARRWALPPVDDDAVAGIVRLRVEKEFAAAGGDGKTALAFDFADAPAQEGERGVLLVGVRRDRLDGVRALLAGAGLSPVSIGVTALAAVTELGDGQAIVVEGDTTTACVREAGKTGGLGAVPTHAQRARWTADVSRLLTTLPTPVGTAATARQLIDLSGAHDELIEAGTARWPDAQIQQADPAEAVGRAALTQGDDAPRIDWQADRLTPPPPQRFGRAAAWSLRAAVLLLVVAAGLWFFWGRAVDERDALRAELDAIGGDAAQLKTMHADTRAAAGWFDDRPPVMDCLLELTRTFPTAGRIWVTQFSLDDGRAGVVRCKAQDKDTMLSYLEAMQASAALRDVELRDWNEGGRDERTVVFEIAFRYAPPPEVSVPRSVDVGDEKERGVAG